MTDIAHQPAPNWSIAMMTATHAPALPDVSTPTVVQLPAEVAQALTDFANKGTRRRDSLQSIAVVLAIVTAVWALTNDAMTRGTAALQTQVNALEHSVERRDARLDTLESRFGALETKVGVLDARVQAMEVHFGARFDKIEQYLEKLDAKLDRALRR